MESEEKVKTNTENQSFKEKRRVFIRTMGKDLEKILSSRTDGFPEEVKTESIPPEISIPSERRLSEKPFFKILLIVAPIIILVGGIVFVYFRFFEQPFWPGSVPTVPTHLECQNEKCIKTEGEGENTCVVDEDCKTQPPLIVPTALLKVQSNQGIALSGLNKDEFFAGLEEITDFSWPEGSLIRILPALGPKDNPRELLNLSQLLQLVELVSPQDILTNLEEDYTLFLYSAGEIERNRCMEEGIGNSQCWGPRLGIVIKIKNPEEVKEKLFGWESTMVQDIKPLILYPASEEETPEFQDFIYKDRLIRYKNLDISTVTVNYTVIDDLLLIGTSKHSIFAAIDAINR